MRKTILLLLLLITVNAVAQTTITVTFPHEGFNLNGRLMLPAGSGTPPVILVAPGSGANDRNATVTLNGGNYNCLYPGLIGQTVLPYLGLSDALADSGYAVFTFDKLEYTYPNPGTITFAKLWMQIRSAVNYLKTRTDIDPNKIVIIGHSEGSSLAPYVALTEPSIKALISLAGPRRPIDTVLAYQLPYIAQTCGGDVAMANAQATQILQYCGDVRTGNYNSLTPPLLGVPPAVWEDYFKVVDSVSHHYNTAARPTLFIGLGDDFNVPPAVELVRFQNEITIPADFYNLQGLNHFLTTANDPAVSEGLTDTIINWLRGQVPLSVNTVNGNATDITARLSYGNLVATSAKGNITSVRLYDLGGRLILSEKVNAAHYERIVPGLATAGLYVAEVNTVRGSRRVKVQMVW